MKVSDPLQMNDWEIIPFLKAVITIHLIFLGLICLDILGFSIPVIQPLSSILYLTFIPGILIIRILRLHNLGPIETLLYSVGLSIAALMLSGFFINMVYPFFGIQDPFSFIPLVITISAMTFILCILCYVRDKGHVVLHIINFCTEDYLPIFFLSLIPCMSVLGAYLMNVHHNNTLLMFMVVAIAIIALLIGFDKVIPAKFYPLAIFMLALSLLLHRSLISMNLWGWDIFHEYYIANLVIENAFWDSTIPFNTNAMLSIVFILPIYSSLCSMSPVWVLKIIYPFIFSFVPLGLYQAVQKQTNEKIAFFAMFFFISFFTFYSEMLSLARQQMAELFLVLTILIIIDKTMGRRQSLFLLVIFGASIIVSHYALTWVYLPSLIAAWILLLLMEQTGMQTIKQKIYSKIRKYGEHYPDNPYSPVQPRTITLPYVLFFVLFTVFWYTTFSGGSTLESILNIGENIATSFSEEFLNPDAAQGLGLIIKETTSPLNTISKSLHLMTIFFIVFGLLILIYKKHKFRFENEYMVFSWINLLICIGGVTLPFFASALNTTRLYQITLIFLAPFCIIGGIIVFKSILRPVYTGNPYVAISIFLVIFLAFNSGFVDEIATGESSSIALNPTYLAGTTDFALFNDREVSGAQWLYSVHNNSIYADATQQNLWRIYGDAQAGRLPEKTIEIGDDSYLYLGTYNIEKNQIRVLHTEQAFTYERYIDSRRILRNNHKIFANGGAEVYYG
ncbi:DUF2206 domain-containing protein [Methanogenium sp. S4BF]|uniref:DUF2206 domain-containing protein n=1 Tax=Methanogenium sp. S4BF TaxID=1789226 RepID=UPI002417D2A1|nr:DUF2206 domain-containing protein [Methanogenium sp. S4BF]WFN35320.1 DUF2206 domain-containing protein [Methanogenium sp. S4BF]